MTEERRFSGGAVPIAARPRRRGCDGGVDLSLGDPGVADIVAAVGLTRDHAAEGRQVVGTGVRSGLPFRFATWWVRVRTAV